MVDRQALETIVREAGALALASWPGHGHALDWWEKTPGSPVCTADLAVDDFLRRELRALLPGSGWLSEETADHPERLSQGWCWLVDPIDGTRDYVAGRDGWAVSVALVDTGRPVAGLLHAPARGQLWSASEGGGAWRNGERLRASTRERLLGSRVPADMLPVADHDLVTVEKPNSIALRITKVAADEADLLATLRWGFEWDVAAASLIAGESGATVSDAFGRPLVYNKRDPRAFGVLVSAPAIHAAAVERLAGRATKLAAQ